MRCIVCETEFTAKRKHAQTCGATCRGILFRRRHDGKTVEQRNAERLQSLLNRWRRQVAAERRSRQQVIEAGGLVEAAE
jgi:hypothetical protein